MGELRKLGAGSFWASAHGAPPFFGALTKLTCSFSLEGCYLTKCCSPLLRALDSSNCKPIRISALCDGLR
jgi:hypothetical protein